MSAVFNLDSEVGRAGLDGYLKGYADAIKAAAEAIDAMPLEERAGSVIWDLVRLRSQDIIGEAGDHDS